MSDSPLLRLQQRTLDSSLVLDGMRKVKDVTKILRRRVARAFKDQVLIADCTHLIRQKRAKIELPKRGLQELIVVWGGVEINRERDPSKEHFRRSDGAWFDFHVHLRHYDGERAAQRGLLELVGYGYELRFPAEAGCDVRWIRFDLNHPGHENDERNVRAHFHPGDEDLQAPSAVLQPDEAIELLLSDLLQLPQKRRS